MGSLYFVRHGETYWNVENKICGATDIALTPLGHEQAVRTAEEIVRSGIRFDEILSSLDELKADPQGRSYLLVAHNGIARVVESYFRPMTNAEYASFGVRNCAILTYEL